MIAVDDVRECPGCEDPESARHAADCHRAQAAAATLRKIIECPESGPALGSAITLVCTLYGTDRADLVDAVFEVLTTDLLACQADDAVLVTWNGQTGRLEFMEIGA